MPQCRGIYGYLTRQTSRGHNGLDCDPLFVLEAKRTRRLFLANHNNSFSGCLTAEKVTTHLFDSQHEQNIAVLYSEAILKIGLLINLD